MSTIEAIQEAAQRRIWRERCGEPGPDYPVRCRRDLDHHTPHVGLIGMEPVIWFGEGNSTSAQTGPGVKCWCRR